MSGLSHFTHMWFYYSSARRERGKAANTSAPPAQCGGVTGQIGLNYWARSDPMSVYASRAPVVHVKHSRLNVYMCACVCEPYISVMVSGRLVGISVRPFPLQSTMLLLQVQDSGHCSTLQEEDEDDW